MRKRTSKWRGRGAARGVAAACALLALGGCGFMKRSPPVRADPVEMARIRSEVEARLAAEPSIDVDRVRVEVSGSTVALHGSVTGFGALQCAISNAGLVRGVDNVADLLVVEPGPRAVSCHAPRGRAGSAGGPSPRPER